MKKLLTITMSLVLIAMAVWLVGCAKEDSNGLAPVAGSGAGSNELSTVCTWKTSGTYGNVTADCFNRVSWTIAVAALPDATIECESGTDITVPYTVDATQSAGIEGEVCFTNEPSDDPFDNPTCNTRLTIVLEYNAPGPGGYVPVKTWDLGNVEDISSGETKCYPYSVLFGDFVPVAGGDYRITPQLSIDNHGNGAWTFETHQPVELDCYFDTPECGELTVSPACPTTYDSENQDAVADFTCTVKDPASATYTESGSGSFLINIYNNLSSKDEAFTTQICVNGITSCDETLQDCTPLAINTGVKDCGTIDDGCGLTIGYWKTHSVEGLYGNNAGVGQALLDANGAICLGTYCVSTGQMIVNTMKDMGPNGIAKLYAQMLAVKLNILNGANDACVADALAAADAFLTGKTTSDWANLSKDDRSLVLGWMSMFDKYNNGELYVDDVLCVPHCE
jgi:hypothetical protein